MDYRDIGVTFQQKKQRVFGVSVTALEARKADFDEPLSARDCRDAMAGVEAVE